MARLFQLPKQVPIVGGAVSPGAKAHFHLTGTTTDTNTYTDDALTTPHANPVVADAAGVFAAIYLDPDIDYRLILDDADDALIYDVDPVMDTVDIRIDQTPLESDNSITPVSMQYDPGETFRYMTAAQITDVQSRAATLDVSTPCQNAIDSGHHCYFNEGKYGSEVMLTVGSDGGLIGGKAVTMSAGVRVERFTNNTDPIMQVYGVQNRVEFNGAQLVSRTYASPKGILLLGPDPDAVDATPADQVSTQINWIDYPKVFGQTDTLGNDGSIGIYVHSPGRKRGVWLSIHTFYNTINAPYVSKCDKSIEFSSDANANSVPNSILLNFGESAVMFNASYGNHLPEARIEQPIAVTSTRRYAVHFGEQNYSVSGETGTDASYPIHGALNNSVGGFCETLNTGSQVVSVFTIVDPPGSGTNYGQNFNRLSGAQPAGQGTDGLTDEDKIHDTVIDNDTVFANHHRPMRLTGDLNIKLVDDASGPIDFRDSTAWVGGRKADMVEGTNYDVIQIDNVAEGTLFIKLTYSSNEETNSSAFAGVIYWLCQVEGGSANTPIKFFDPQNPAGETASITPVIAAAAGTAASSGKFTVTFNTNSVAGTGNSFCGWNAELVSSKLEGTNLDWAFDVKYLTTTS